VCLYVCDCMFVHCMYTVCMYVCVIERERERERERKKKYFAAFLVICEKLKIVILLQFYPKLPREREREGVTLKEGVSGTGTEREIHKQIKQDVRNKFNCF
jgi:hypothetical protein